MPSSNTPNSNTPGSSADLTIGTHPNQGLNLPTSVSNTETTTTNGTTSNVAPSSAIASAPSTVAADSAVAPETEKTRTKPITKAAKAELHAYFASLNWPLNKQLRKGAFASDLQTIVDKHSLLRPQISRQLINFKKAKYGLSLVRLMLSKDELTGKLQEGLGMCAKEFVTSTLSHIKKQSSPNLDFNNFSRIINAFPENTGIILVGHFINDPESECCKLLANLVDRWTTYAAEEFPKTAANLPRAELQFQSKKRLHKTIFVKKWKEEHSNACGGGVL